MFRCNANVSGRCRMAGAVSAVLFHGVAVSGQTLNLPARPTDALIGSRFTNLVAYAARDDRENWIYAQVVSGNVPGWLRTLKPINTSMAGHTGTYHVTP